MELSRIDLDGTYSPIGVVGKILKTVPNLKIPVPLEEIASKLDIVDIQDLTTDGFEGGLVTTESRHSGIILVKRGVSRQRRRFTIGHELFHFLNVHHKPKSGEEFLCDRQAMMSWDKKEQRRAVKMEVEANMFSALLLLPPPDLRKILARDKYSRLDTVLELHRTFDVSKEVAARAFADYNPENVAVIISRHGKFLRAYKNRNFPWIKLRQGAPIPTSSDIFNRKLSSMQASELSSVSSEPWLDIKYGERAPRMYEQVLLQSKGFAMILLKIANSEDNDYDPEENMTSKQRLQSRLQRNSKDNWSA